MRSCEPNASPGASSPRLPHPPAADRILVIRLGAIGDVVRTRVAFAGLRALYPEARIDWLVEDRAVAALDAIVGLDGRVVLPRGELGIVHPLRSLAALRGVARELRARRYDLVVDFHGILKSGLLARASRAPVRVGYTRAHAREVSHRFLTHRVALTTPHASRFERNAALVRFLGGEVPQAPPPLAIPAALRERYSDVARGCIVMHPGTSASTRYKRWPAERYAAVAERLQELEGRESVVTWGPVAGERECAERVVAAARGAARLAPPTAGPVDLLALLRSAALFVGSDSGPMHLASLAGVPVTVIFGPTDAVENAPFAGTPARVLRHDVGCGPCRRGCPVLACMDAVTVDEVVTTARALVAAAPAVR